MDGAIRNGPLFSFLGGGIFFFAVVSVCGGVCKQTQANNISKSFIIVGFKS